MEQRLPKKESEMNTMDLYSHFRDGMITLIKEHFNGKDQMLEPAFFIGVRKDAMRKQLKKMKDSIPKDIYEKMAHDVREETDISIHAMIVPLGKFMSEHGNLLLNGISKDIARVYIDSIIADLRRLDYNCVMFTCFVTESNFAKIKTEDMDPEIVKDLELGRIDPTKVFTKEFIDKHTERKDTVAMMFETINSSQVVALDILRSKEGNYQELINEEILPLSEKPSQGLFSGIIHKGISANQN